MFSVLTWGREGRWLSTPERFLAAWEVSGKVLWCPSQDARAAEFLLVERENMPGVAKTPAYVVEFSVEVLRGGCHV